MTERLIRMTLNKRRAAALALLCFGLPLLAQAQDPATSASAKAVDDGPRVDLTKNPPKNLGTELDTSQSLGQGAATEALARAPARLVELAAQTERLQGGCDRRLGTLLVRGRGRARQSTRRRSRQRGRAHIQPGSCRSEDTRARRSTTARAIRSFGSGRDFHFRSHGPRFLGWLQRADGLGGPIQHSHC